MKGAIGIAYECMACRGTVFIPHAAAWPQQCPHCRVWSPQFSSPGFMPSPGFSGQANDSEFKVTTWPT